MLHPVDSMIRSISEPVLGNRFFNRHFAMARVSTGIGMPTHVEEMKEEDCQAEQVMVGSSNKFVKFHPLKLWRREQWHTYIAGKDIGRVLDLEGVTIDEHHCPIRSYEEVAVVNIPYDMPLLMNHSKGSGDVSCDMNQKLEVRIRKGF